MGVEEAGTRGKLDAYRQEEQDGADASHSLQVIRLQYKDVQLLLKIYYRPKTPEPGGRASGNTLSAC